MPNYLSEVTGYSMYVCISNSHWIIIIFKFVLFFVLFLIWGLLEQPFLFNMDVGNNDIIGICRDYWIKSNACLFVFLCIIQSLQEYYY